MPSGERPPEDDPRRSDGDLPPEDPGARDPSSPADPSAPTPDPAAGQPPGDAPPPGSLSPPPAEPAASRDPDDFPAAGTPPPDSEPLSDTEPLPGSEPPLGSEPPPGGRAGSYRADEPPPHEAPPPGTPPPGAPPPGAQPGAQGVPPAPTGPDSRNWAMATHLSALAMFVGIPWFIGPLVVWLLKRDDPFVDAHGKEALNFNLSLLIYGVALLVAGVVGGIVTLGLLVVPVALIGMALGIAWLVLTIVASVKASNGEAYQYPLTLRLVQ